MERWRRKKEGRKRESHWFTVVDDSLLRWEKVELRKRRSEMEGKDDNIVTRDANLVGTLMDDPTTMKLDRRTSMNWKKIWSRSFLSNWVSCVNLYLEYMLKKVTLLSLQLHLMIFSIMFHKNNIFLLWKISVRNRKS